MGLVVKYMKEHTAVNEIWDEGQLGAVEGVLGTGGKAKSSQPGNSLLRLGKGIQQSPPWLDDKGVRMDGNTKECDQAYQRVDEEMENEIGDLEGWWKDDKSMDTDIVGVPTRW